MQFQVPRIQEKQGNHIRTSGSHAFSLKLDFACTLVFPCGILWMQQGID
jgi:hypothetical protein